MTQVFLCVPAEAVQDLGDHVTVDLGSGEEAVRTILAAMGSPGKVARAEGGLVQALAGRDGE